METKGIFPLQDREISILHDLGWNSGFGYRDEWDWWRGDAEPYRDPDNDTTRLLLMRHVLIIRATLDAASEISKKILKDFQK